MAVDAITIPQGQRRRIQAIWVVVNAAVAGAAVVGCAVAVGAVVVNAAVVNAAVAGAAVAASSVGCGCPWVDRRPRLPERAWEFPRELPRAGVASGVCVGCVGWPRVIGTAGGRCEVP